MKQAVWKFIIVVALVAPLVGPTPAQAANAGGGSIAFEGTASLPKFPCAPPQPGDFPCSGTFTGRVGGALSGVHGPNNTPWAIEIVTSPRQIATFNYFDEIEPGVPCFEGMARASGTVTAGLGEVFGAYGSTLPVPLPVTAIEMTFQFDWRRIGTAAVMEFTSTKVVLTVTGLASPVTVVDVPDRSGSGIPAVSPGYGGAVFVPDPVQFRDRLPACEGAAGDPSAAGPLTATVAGEANFTIAKQ